jgi:PilZ domain-containing protein
MPFVRSAVLEVDGRSHIVALTDLSPEGAFLSTRLDLRPEQKLRLRLVLPRDSREVTIDCQLVWRSDRFDVSTGRPAGSAVRFDTLGPSIVRRVEEFALEGFRPSPAPAPAAHFEYRVLERPDLNAAELNELGLDGWQLASALRSPAGVRLILFRQL